ncbi:hypothetical protein [Rubrivirga sp.]|uniref:hypothetical protein n=1 Tax=Rubrivirga sp. TaxID=1885344 RepID=UPI003C71FAB7
MRFVLIALVLVAGCNPPGHEERERVMRSHTALMDSLRAVPRCPVGDDGYDRDFYECRYRRAVEELAVVRRSEYVTLDGATLRDEILTRHQSRVALTALDAGRLEEARGLVDDVRGRIAEAEEDEGYDRYSWSDALEDALVVEGRLALARGDRETAGRLLLEVGRMLESPTQLSFGPNTTLARDLAAAGDTAVVEAYFDVLDSTWEYGAERVAEWRQALAREESPDYGPNVIY